MNVITKKYPDSIFELFCFFSDMKILKISKINSNISENIENYVFESCEQSGMDSAPYITPIGAKSNLGFSKSTIMVEILEIFEIFKTLIDYTRELRDQMGWKSPDSWFSDNVDMVLKNLIEKYCRSKKLWLLTFFQILVGFLRLLPAGVELVADHREL